MKQHMIEIPVLIDHQLRFVFFGLEQFFGVTFSAMECEKVFDDAIFDQTSAKRYCFCESPRFYVSGRVDDYEPDQIWLETQGNDKIKDHLNLIIEAASNHAFRLKKSIRF
jgi:hypothetical protein